MCRNMFKSDDLDVSFGGCLAMGMLRMLVADFEFSIAIPPKLVRAMLATLT